MDKVEIKEIDKVVCRIMQEDGPDRHVDGHEVITDFIVSLLCGMSPKGWLQRYEIKKKEEQEEREREDKDFLEKYGVDLNAL